MKRAFIVAGPGSTGTHLVAQILQEMGCASEELIRWNSWLPLEEDLAVIRWSYPHAKRWPDMTKVRETLSMREYKVREIITMRDYKATIASQLEHKHVRSEREARRNITEAYRRLFSNPIEFPLIVSYDSLVRRPKKFIAWLSEELGLSGEVTVSVTDETVKHYKIEEE